LAADKRVPRLSRTRGRDCRCGRWRERLAGIAGDAGVVVHEDGGGASRLEERRVAFVGEEGDLAGVGFFEAGDARDFYVGGRIEAAVDFFGKVRQLHGVLSLEVLRQESDIGKRPLAKVARLNLSHTQLRVSPSRTSLRGKGE